MLRCCISLRSEISRMAVEGTPSSSCSRRIFLSAIVSLVWRSLPLYTTPYVPSPIFSVFSYCATPFIPAARVTLHYITGSQGHITDRQTDRARSPPRATAAGGEGRGEEGGSSSGAIGDGEARSPGPWRGDPGGSDGNWRRRRGEEEEEEWWVGTGSLGPGGGACGLSRAEPPASSSATGSALLFVARGCRRCHFKNADEINHRSRVTPAPNAVPPNEAADAGVS